MYPNLKIIGTGSYLPPTIVKTEEFVGIDLWKYDKNDMKIGDPKRFDLDNLIGVTGIYERRKASPLEMPSDLGYKASLAALESARIPVDSLVGIIVASVTERQNFASAAVKIQNMLGARNVEVAYDIQNACAGFPEALAQANSRSRDVPGYWLAIASETLSKINDFEDMNCHLFGDGAGAAVLRTSFDGMGILGTYSRSEPFDGGIDMISKGPISGVIRMPDGNRVLRKAVRAMVDSAKALKKQVRWRSADVYIAHQANKRILDAVEEQLRADGDEAIVYKNIRKYGNMSAATCAVALDEAILDGTIKEGSRVIVTSFGAGLVTSAVAMQF